MSATTTSIPDEASSAGVDRPDTGTAGEPGGAPAASNWRRFLPRRPALVVPAVAITGIGVVGPFIILALYSLGVLGDQTVGGPFEAYTTLVGDEFYRSIFWRSLRLSVGITVVTLVLGYPLATSIARSHGWRRTFLLYVTITPLLINIVVRTLGWLVILSDQGLLNSVAGWISPSLQRSYLGTELGLAISLVHIALPLMVLPLLSSIEQQDPSLREAALTTGAHPLVAWWRVTLPLLGPGLVAGCTLVFVLGMSSLVTPALLGQGRMYVVSTLLVRQIGQLRWTTAAALAILLFAAVLVAVIAMQRVAARVAMSRPEVAVSRALPRRPITGLLARANALGTPRRTLGAIRFGFLTLIVVYLLVPLVIVLKSSFDDSRVMRTGFGPMTLEWYRQALDPALYLSSAALSMRLAIATVIIGMILAVPAAIAIVRCDFPGRRAVFSFLMSPLLLPQSALAVGFVLFFLFLGTGPSFWRLLLAHIIVALPYMVRVLVSALEGVDGSMEEAASAAGAPARSVLIRITLPLIKPGLFAAVLFGFLMSFDEATVGVLVAASGTPTLPVRIFSELQVQYSPVAAAVSGLLILLVLAVILPLERRIGLMAPRSSRSD